VDTDPVKVVILQSQIF